LSNTPPDISPVVRDDVRRLTYAELAAVRGISRASAERLARRKRWPRQVGNDGIARVIVPLAAVDGGTPDNMADNHPGYHGPDKVNNISDATSDILAAIREVSPHWPRRLSTSELAPIGSRSPWPMQWRPSESLNPKRQRCAPRKTIGIGGDSYVG
jgi:hypothetical protein